jgi:tetratricopeptide (TPR) repeat protein
LEEVVSLDPLDGEALIMLGQFYSPANAEKAIFYYERAEGIEKYEAEARLRHGQILVKGGKYQDALPLLKRAQELKPRDDLQRYIEQVERAARRSS